MTKGKLVRVHVLYIVAAAAVGALFIVLQLRVNTRSSLYNSFQIWAWVNSIGLVLAF